MIITNISMEIAHTYQNGFFFIIQNVDNNYLLYVCTDVWQQKEKIKITIQ